MTDVEQRFEPDPRNAEQYDALFHEVYRPLFPAPQPQRRRLAQLRAD